jgi:hypothetical protein
VLWNPSPEVSSLRHKLKGVESIHGEDGRREEDEV